MCFFRVVEIRVIMLVRAGWGMGCMYVNKKDVILSLLSIILWNSYSACPNIHIRKYL